LTGYKNVISPAPAGQYLQAGSIEDIIPKERKRSIREKIIVSNTVVET
jgi:hypothetical protein